VFGRRGEEDEGAAKIVADDRPNGAEDIVKVLDWWIEDECDVEVHASHGVGPSDGGGIGFDGQ